ncbi:DNA-3-methyladenine glycosylase I [Fluviicola sp.]|uniref:DNA-3-methyladenine glycosylase I n=1 Tax=Fluviicola sp. TaxID=1917219 RepID=UPI0031D4D4CD
MSYCDYVLSKPKDDVHRIYHDFHYGTPIEDDHELFGRLILEINQAGLSWDTILKKQANFSEAFDVYDIEKIANYQEDKVNELLQNAGIIRNKLKINAVIYNAQQLLLIQKEFGSFKYWLDSNLGKSKEEWVKLFKKHFKFVGGEIVNEFLMSTGYLPGAHQAHCYRYKELNTGS